MSGVDSKSKLTAKDFPPTNETDKLRIWDVEKLNIVPDKNDSAVSVDIEKEEVFETRVYTDDLKVLSKRDLASGVILMVVRAGKDLLQKTVSGEEQYRNEVAMLEATFMLAGVDISNVVVATAEEFRNGTKEILHAARKKAKGLEE